jgi:ABC-type branched-subunit amino acid transport system substrate-binding protein
MHRLIAKAGFALALAGMALGAFAEVPGVTQDEILIGQDVDLSGSIAVRMKTFTQAADAYFEHVNQAGGVNGRKIRIVRVDSANKPDKTKENVKALVEQKGVFALWGMSGTGNVAAALPYLTDHGVPLISSTSGADPFYQKTHNVLINVKAGYGDEIRRMVAHLKETQVEKIGLIYLDNGFGKEVRKTALEAAKANQVEVVAEAAHKEDMSDVAQAVEKVSKASPAAVLMLTLAGPAPKVIDAYLKTGVPTQMFALSIVASDSLYKALGEKARGVIVTQIVPFPWDRNIPLVREYQDTVRAKGVTDYSPTGMEGFLSAKALVLGLQGAGRKLTREGLIQSFEAMRPLDMGGVKLAYSPTDHNGSEYVEITMISKAGKLVR